MKQFLHIKFLFTFLAGLCLGIVLTSGLYAQNIDTTSVTSHLRTAHNSLDESLNVRVFPGNKNMKYVKIFDIIGNEVASIDLSNRVSKELSFTIDGSKFETGIYLCNLYSDKGIVETRKLYWSK